MRPYYSVNQQINQLQNKGMNFKSIPKAKSVLENTNYYNIINGFKSLFVDTTIKPEHYVSNLYFEEVIAINNFDKKLKNLILRYILIIEDTLRRHVAHEFARTEGSDKWTIPSSFDLITTINQPTYVSSMINKITNNASRVKNDSHDDMINHFSSAAEIVPIWALVNTFEFGTLKIFLINMKQSIRDYIANKYYSLTFTQLKSFLETINMFRNVCAHDYRIMFYRIYDMDKKISDMPIHKKMNIQKDGLGHYIFGKNDLFSMVLVFKYMLTQSDFKDFYIGINNILRVLRRHLNVVSMKQIYDSLGFPLPNGPQFGWKSIIDVNKF